MSNCAFQTIPWDRATVMHFKGVHLKGIGKKQGVWIGGEEGTVCSGL